MYGLPQSTEIKKQLPKKAIYAKFNMPTSQREHFDADIARIDIEVGVSKATVPALAEGEEIKEFYVLGIQLKRKEYDPKNILMLTKLLPHKMIFALHYEEEIQFAIYHTKLITSEWQLITYNSELITLNLASAACSTFVVPYFKPSLQAFAMVLRHSSSGNP